MAQTPSGNNVQAGDIIAAVRSALAGQYEPLKWKVGYAKTSLDAYAALQYAADAGAIILTWGGDDSEEKSSPVTRGFVNNMLDVIVQMPKLPTATARASVYESKAGRDSVTFKLNEIRGVLLKLRFTVNGQFLFNEGGNRGSVYSRLRYLQTRPFGEDVVQTDAFTMRFSFRSEIEISSFDAGDPDGVQIEIMPQSAQGE